MNNLLFFLLFFGLSLSMGLAPKENLYQVISSHPHDIEKLSPHIETAYQSGRLWIVRLKNNAPSSLKKHLKPLSGKEKSYFYRPMFQGLKKRNPSYLDRLVDKVNRENIRKDVIELSSYKTRYAGTRENQEAIQNVAVRLQSYGLDVQEICYRPQACSLVADKKGSLKPQEVIIVMAHIDSVGKAFAGADDNASGTAVLLEIARVLQDYENNKTIRFFITNGEELGLLGANHYVRKLTSEGSLININFVINMDMVGFNSNGIIELETDPQFEKLATWYAELVDRYTSLKSKITLGAWGSDHVPFLKKGVPALLTIEDWDTKTPCYHQACDKPETLNFDYATEVGKLNISAVVTQDQR